ncbi:calcium/sodium antiporter [Pseudomonas sp. 21LCFQ02]|uniref:calcium/sodium antiporter n=1 Tax=Pseudomonas sp. 21LCFQ02 TaxID=2957505 RepID=UPI00209AE57F|nr:calcium/sodium antiporter [Pseudomonas sp. 21LCFQ02]MCO8166672.1 calcium/sodium antiporter [Pseudomonas sp. 21LCFQ02]
MASGLLLLLIGAGLSVRAAVGLAALLQVRALIIGLTVVALGSSAPQLSVGLQAALTASPDIAVGSVVGGHIFNMLVTLGLCALIIPLRVPLQVVRIDIPLLIGACVLLFVLARNGEISTLDGVILLLGLAACLLIILRQASRGARHGHYQSTEQLSRRPQAAKHLLMLAAGLTALVSGGHMLVEATVVIAIHLGLSERIIGLTLMAVATSIPALLTSLIAALRGERDIAVGNVIGSSLFNLLGVLGLTTLVAPQPLSVSPNSLVYDLPIMLGVTVLCLPLLHSGLRIDRLKGLLLLALYALYGLDIIGFSTGSLQAERLESLMLRFVLPTLTALVLLGMLRSWWRQHR